MRPMNEIEIELPQIVLDRADAAYAQIRQQAAQESPADRRVRSFPRAAGILLAVVILSVTAVSATAAGIMGYRRYLAERMTDIGTEELGHLEMVAEQGNVTAEFSRELTARERSIYEQLTREYEADGKYPVGQIRELAEDGELFRHWCGSPKYSRRRIRLSDLSAGYCAHRGRVAGDYRVSA